jgi:beta-lactamase class A
MITFADLDAELDAVPGTVSVWCAPVTGGIPRYARLPDARHYAASTVKVAVLAALHRAHQDGALDIEAEVPVRNRFGSALPDAPDYQLTTGYDNDDAVWARLDGTASLRWLAERMIVRSSNFATNVVLSHLGQDRVAEVWRLAGATHSSTPRGIEDYAARDAGIDNLITAGDLARLLAAIAAGAQPPGHPICEPAGCRQMLATLQAQEHREDLVAGLPDGTRIAHKNGWITGVRHGAGVVFPDDADPYTIVVCASTPLAGEGADDDACRLIARVAAASWDHREPRYSA